MNTNLKILYLEDDELDAELVRRILMGEGLVREMVRVETGDEFTRLVTREIFDLIVSDYTLPGFDGMTALKRARDTQPDTPFIFVSGTIEEDLAIESLKQGASDYVFKNRLSRLGPAVRRALRGVEESEKNRRAEEAMRQSEHKYRQLFESLSDAAFLSDFESGRVLDTNPQGELLLGRTRGEIIGMNQGRFHTPENYADYRRTLSAADGRKAALDFEGQIIRQDGSLAPVEIRATSLELYGRKLLLGLYRNITQRKQVEEKIHEQAKLLDLVPDAIMVRDMEDRLQYWNEGAVRLYGWTPEEALGRKSSELLYHDRGEFQEAKRVILTRGEWSGELHQIDRANHEVVVYSRWKLLRNEQGKPKSILLVNTDITAKPHNRLDEQTKQAELLHRRRQS